MKTIKQIKEIAEASDMACEKFEAGASPYSSFSLVLTAKGNVVGETPMTFKKSKEEIVSWDPSTAYKGRHAVGILYLATRDDDDGLIEVNSWEDHEVELANGMCLGTKPELVSLSDLFY